MKLIYIANIRIPTEKAHGVQIMKMCEAFSNQGVEVKLVVPKRDNKIKMNIWEYYNQKPNFEIEYLRITDFMKLEIPRISFFLQSRSFLKSVLSYLKKEEFDLIYCRDLLFIKHLGKLNNNLFCELHSLPKSFNKNDLSKAKGVITITQGLKNDLIKKGVSKDRIMVVPDGVDLNKFDINISKKEAREKVKLPLDKKIVLYVGHLYKWKGAHILAEAAKMMNNDIKVVFVGGTDKDMLEFKKKYGSIENIEIKGHISYSSIPFWMKSADVLVLPNSAKKDISEKWTSPMKMFEYMASKRPIVASDIPSIREILNKNNAVLVEPDNPKTLAEGINSILKKLNFSAKISMQAWKNISQYTWDKRAESILRFIKKQDL